MTMTEETQTMKNAIFCVDWENVGGCFDFFIANHRELLQGQKIVFFFRLKDQKVSFSTLKELNLLNMETEFICCNGNGKNYLDFCLSIYCGILIGKKTANRLYIVSNDTGFEVVTGFVTENFDAEIQMLKVSNTAVVKDEPLPPTIAPVPAPTVVPPVVTPDPYSLLKRLKIYRPDLQNTYQSLESKDKFTYPIRVSENTANEVETQILNLPIAQKNKIKMVQNGKRDFVLTGGRSELGRLLLFLNGVSDEQIKQTSRANLKALLWNN